MCPQDHMREMKTSMMAVIYSKSNICNLYISFFAPLQTFSTSIRCSKTNDIYINKRKCLYINDCVCIQYYTFHRHSFVSVLGYYLTTIGHCDSIRISFVYYYFFKVYLFSLFLLSTLEILIQKFKIFLYLQIHFKSVLTKRHKVRAL